MTRKIVSLFASLAILIGTTGTISTPAVAAVPSQAPTAASGPVKGFPPKAGQNNGKAVCVSGSPRCFTYAGTNAFFGTAPTGATSIKVTTSQHKTFKNSGDAHTLWEVAAQNDGTTVGQGNIAEIGWTRDLGVCGSTIFATGNPCLFVYSWINGAGQGYNAANPGWVDNPTESVNAGTALATTAGGAQPTVFYEYEIKFASSAKCDNVTTDGTPVQTTSTAGILMSQQNVGSTRLIGCFPLSFWTAAGETFTAINQAQSFNESATMDDHPCTDLGSGIFAPATNVASASQDTIAFTGTGAPAGTTFDWPVNNAQVRPAFNDPNGARVLQIGTQRYRSGGPMWNSTGTATGSAGAC